MRDKPDDLIFDQGTIPYLSVYCPACEEGKAAPFVQAKRRGLPTMGELDSYRQAEEVVDEWAVSHASTCEARTRALTAV